MNLPNLTIPFELPFNVPIGLHSPIVHFAVAIPVIVILLEFINIFFRKRSLSVFSLFLTLLLATVIIGAYYTGVTDGQEAFDMLSKAGKEELKEHKEFGIILVYASLAFVVLKLFFMLFKGAVSRMLFLFISLAFTGAILKQGHDGGELVYEYGANNKALQKAIEINSDLKDELEELKEECKDKEEKATPKEESKTSESESATQDIDKDSKTEESAKEDNTTVSSNDSNSSQ